jgi:FKBP-type peptidyl-prolyl cis-trans isomerase FkpA/FKBP-type peptidyl-prolyl cis-trans isomerase FklB
MLQRFGTVLLLVAGFLSCAPGEPTPVALETEEQKTLYALGFTLASAIRAYGLDEGEVDLVLGGARDAALGREAQVPMNEYRAKVRGYDQEKRQAMARQEQEEGKAFLEEMAAQEGAVRTESGLIMQEIQPGSGESPAATDRVSVHYHGTLRDGSVFDSSVQRGTPATFALNRVIKCWTEGVQKMKVGGKSRLICPPDIAYGSRGSPPRIPPGSVLVFEVELLAIE